MFASGVNGSGELMIDRRLIGSLRTVGLALLFVCGVTACLALLIPPRAIKGIAHDEVHVHKGMRVAAPKGYQWALAPQSLVVGARMGCPYCEASMPFYVRLAELERTHPLKTKILIVCPGANDAFGPLWPVARPRLQMVTRVDLASLGIAVTPTVLLVDTNGFVLDLWEGQLSSRDENELLAYLNQEGAME